MLKKHLTGWKWLAAAVVLMCAVGIALHFQLPERFQAAMQSTLEHIKGLGFWAPFSFVLLYIASCVAVIPGSVLTMGAGAVFGIVKGSIYVSIGATLGATAAFLVGRYFVRDWVARKFGEHPAFKAIDRAVAKEGWKIVFLTRLCPVFPFFLMNYAYSLTRVSLRDYVLATWIGIIPGSTLFVYIGSMANSDSQPSTAAGWMGRGFILITAIVATIALTRVARRALATKTCDAKPSA